MTGGKKITDALNEAMAWAEGHDTGAVLHHAPPAAPCADEVEVVARAIHNEAVRQHNTGEIDPTEAGPQMARVILAALSPLRQAERERAWRAANEKGARQ